MEGNLMMRGIALIAFGAGLALASAASAAPIQWTGAGSNGHSYEFVGSVLEWQDAKNAAAAMTFGGDAGHLATATSADENNFIEGLLGTANAAWLGAGDALILGTTEGSYVWVTGEPFTFTHWAATEPNGGTFQNFMQMDGALGISPGSWRDAGATGFGITGYVVEFDTVAQTPIPAALPLFGTALVAFGIAGRRRRKAALKAL
jgi:hypothetical protein